MFDSLKVVLPLSDVPDGEKVSKVTGSKLYVVRRSPGVFVTSECRGECHPQVRLNVEPGCVCLISDSGDISINHGSTEVMWRTSLDNLVMHRDIEGSK